MALALSNTTPRLLGFGYYVSWTGASGPVPVDDYVVLYLRKTGSFPQPLIAYGRVEMFGFTSGSLVIGIDSAGRYFPQSYEFLASGAGVDTEISQYHANGTLVTGPNVLTGFTWDPSSQLGQLSAIAASKLGSSSSAILERILAAVYRPFPLN